MKIKNIRMSLEDYPATAILGSIANSLQSGDVNTVAKRKQQEQNDRVAKQFLDDFFYLVYLKSKFGSGTIDKLLANATVTFGEAAFLTGMPEPALKSAVLNVFKLQDANPIPLRQIVDLAGREVVAAWVFPQRDSYQSCVRVYIQDWFKDEYQKPVLEACSAYLDMSCDQAKYFEMSARVIVGYFKMYPPAVDEVDVTTYDLEKVKSPKDTDTVMEAPPLQKHENTTPPLTDAEKKDPVSSWRTYLSSLSAGKDRDAAQYVLHLLNGEQDTAKIFEMIFPGKKVTPNNRRVTLYRLRGRAEKIAKVKNLPLPW